MEVLTLIDIDAQQILNLICPQGFNVVEIGKLTIDKILEIEKIHTSVSDNSVINLGDKQFHLWMQE